MGAVERADVGIGPYGIPCRGGRPCPPERITHGRGGTHGARPTDGCGNPPLSGLSRRKRLALGIHDVAPVQVAPILATYWHLGDPTYGVLGSTTNLQWGTT